MQGGGQPPPAAVGRQDTAATLERIQSILGDRDYCDRIIQQLFAQYAGGDGKLQQNEMIGLANILSIKIGVDKSLFDNMESMFFRFDFDGSETLDLKECGKLIKYILKEEKRTLAPRDEHTLTRLERKDLKANFTLGKKLGQGGQGAVYLATTKTGTKRVVKFYEKSGGNSCMEDIKDEFELLKRLDHPNIARICEVFEDLSNIYVISEPYTGGDLVTVTQKAQENRIQITHQWYGLIMLQVIEGIMYLHSKETMHCDLKEPNVMIADDKNWAEPHVMLIDFGMAKNFSGVRAGGTPGYMPPEFWQYNLWTPKGDIFALAVTFWGIYNGRQGGPFQVADAGPPFPNIQRATITAPMDCSRFPPGLREIVQAMAQKDFRKRPTAKQVQQQPYFQRLSNMEENQAIDPAMVQKMVDAAKRSACQNMIALELGSKQNLGQMKEMNKLFRQLDGDDDGTVESEEALQVLVNVGLPSSSARQLVDSLIGGDGKIHYSEFMGRMMGSQEAMTAQALGEVFQSLDTDQSGSLGRAEIAELMSRKGMNSLLEGRSPDDLLAEMDGDGDGVVTFAEFKRAMLGDPKPSSGFGNGENVEYYSASYGKWVPCQIIAVENGRVQVSVKPGAWMDQQVQTRSLRKAGGGGGGGYN